MLKSIKWFDEQLSNICYGQLISKNLCTQSYYYWYDKAVGSDWDQQPYQ